LVENDFRDFRRGGNKDGGREGRFENNYRCWYEEKKKVDNYEQVKRWRLKKAAQVVENELHNLEVATSTNMYLL